MDYKTIIGIITVVLAFVAYIPYIRDIFSGRNIPHAFSWFIYAFGTTITYALQIYGGAGVGSWVTLAVTIISWFIFFLCLFKKRSDITKSDVIFLFVSFVALYFWLVVKQPILSAILIVAVDVSGFIPTIRKSWNLPYSETLVSYELHTVRHGLSVLALEQYSPVTWLFPVSWTLMNALFVAILVLRRRKIPDPILMSNSGN